VYIQLVTGNHNRTLSTELHIAFHFYVMCVFYVLMFTVSRVVFSTSLQVFVSILHYYTTQPCNSRYPSICVGLLQRIFVNRFITVSKVTG